MPEENGVGEATFIGEVWITLANRELAEIYIEALNDDVRVNENRVPIVADFATYMLSGRDLPQRNDEHYIHLARIDKGVWEYPEQFDRQGRFLTNGPGMPRQQSEFTIPLTQQRRSGKGN